MVKLIDVAINRAKMDWWREVPDEFYDETSGHVESPEGWIGLLTWNDKIQKEYSIFIENGFYHEYPERLQDGTYYVTIDSDGNVWAYTHKDPVEVRLAYHHSEREYHSWASMQAHIEERTGEF